MGARRRKEGIQHTIVITLPNHSVIINSIRFGDFVDANTAGRVKILTAMMALELDDFATCDVTDDDYVYGHDKFCQVCDESVG